MIIVRGNKRGAEPTRTIRLRQRGAAAPRIVNLRRRQGPGSLIPSLDNARIHLRQKSLRGFSKGFHSLSLSASSRGLVAPAYGQSSSKRKSENVRKAGEKIHV